MILRLVVVVVAAAVRRVAPAVAAGKPVVAWGNGTGTVVWADGHAPERLPGENKAFNYIAAFSIPAPSEKTCHHVLHPDWRAKLVVQFAESHGANWAICSPYGYFFHPGSCACHYCLRGAPLSHDPANTCVSRHWIQRYPPRAAVGIGSARDVRAMLDFYVDAKRAGTIVNVPVQPDGAKNLLAAALPFRGFVDLVLTMPDFDKGDTRIFCETDQRKPAARCAESLRRLFAALDRGSTSRLLPKRGESAPQCDLVFPASFKADKGQLTFLDALASSPVGAAVLHGFRLIYFGRVEFPGYVREIEARLRSLGASYDIRGFVSTPELHKGLCQSDAVAVFPLKDRNPRVSYEALQALRPLFISEEATLPSGTACQDFVTSAHSNRTSKEIVKGFLDFARKLARGIDPGFIEKFITSCISLSHTIEETWNFIAAAHGDSGTLRHKGARRKTLICALPHIIPPSCGDEFRCSGVTASIRNAQTNCQPLDLLPAKLGFDKAFVKGILPSPKSSFNELSRPSKFHLIAGPGRTRPARQIISPEPAP